MLLVTLPILVMYTEAVLIPSLPAIQRQFHVSPSDVSWVLTIYLLTGTISVALMGKLGDMYGKKKLFLIALAVYTLGVTFAGFAPTFHALLLARALQGIGMAIFPLGFTIVREEFPPRMVPQVQGMISAMFGVGIVVALPLGSYIAENYGWELTYHTVAPFAILMLVLSARVLRESRYINPGKLDVPGAVLLSLFAASGLVAVTRAPDTGLTAPSTLAMFALSLASLTLLIVRELKTDNPLIPVSLLTSRNVLITNLWIFLAGFAVQMMNQAITYLFQMQPPYGYSKTILESGLLMTPSAIAMLFIAPLVGRAMTRIGVKPFIQLGALLAIIGLVALSYDPVSIGLWKIVSLVVLVSTGISVLNVSLINILVFSVGRRVMGIATGLNSLFRNLGAAWGPAVAGTLMSMYSHVFYSYSAPGQPGIHTCTESRSLPLPVPARNSTLCCLARGDPSSKGSSPDGLAHASFLRLDLYPHKSLGCVAPR
ncbi:MFS transporter [Pyrodictium abyssi]|uniref:MFS transporter n=1 Tax=Pyrodictium abyssi TaxID=54256 RepID=A0ABM8ISF9_9CREN|nr:MFS transporter [Pyrodictium abyssi]